ncbi:hypothetical protein VHUM_00558 [Vanrija humicola]|uniref:Nudix hydrolase domain-containing protein n=1 Tax=Vanrija humicola TaxID=5417 RepID=A0A7D8V339_VANHU|nr:hypothetical protein VHUM_00558 [Vanrija humicola]
MSFEEVLEDLNARFLVNLPEQETSLVRVYWQAEQAHWFYEDYIRPLNPFLPSLSQRQFTHLIIESSPLYANSAIDYDAIWEEYCAYKKMVPCCGGIIISSNEDKVLMVRGWKSNAGWCFPRGKINSEESDMDCAIREVEEETGYDMSGKVNEKDFIKTQISAQEVTMFLAKGVDESTVFETQTRKEIGAIEWIPFYDLPTWTNKKGPKRTGGKGQKKFYNVTPFVGPLKKWLAKNGINPYPPRPKDNKQQHTNNIPGSGGKQGKERHLQPFAFDDTPAAAQQPATAIDHLFAKFIQKDDGVVALESENARKLDHLFSNLEPKSAEQQAQERKEDDALASLLSGLSTVPAPAPPPADPKQSKLLGILNAPKAASSTTPASPPQSTHQSNLLSMLASPPQAGTSLNVTPSPAPAPGSDSNHDRISRQQALLEASFGSEFGAPQSNLSVPPRSHTHSAATSSGTYPTPNVAPIDMPSPQNYTNPGWHEPQAPPQQPQFNQYSPESAQRGAYDGSPQRLGGQYASPLQQPGQFIPPPYQQAPQQYLAQGPPNGGPAPSDHQRALLGTLFGAGGGAPRPQPQGGFAPLGAPFGAYPLGPQPGHLPPGHLPPGNLPAGFGPGGFPNQYGARPSATGQYGAAPPPLQQQRVYSGGYAPPPQAAAGYGGPGPQGSLPLQQPQQQQQALGGPPPGLAPLPVPPASNPISPSAVHQPVPRPPVGGGLLGLMGGR